MDISSWIVGLMKENSNQVGFIPSTTVQNRYVANEQYILQCDDVGNPVGYLLHGPIKYGMKVVVSQHCIQYEKRLQGYGSLAFQELLDRTELINASSIHLRCADNLPAMHFWKAVGFSEIYTIPGGRSRSRRVTKMIYKLPLPLFSSITEVR